MNTWTQKVSGSLPIEFLSFPEFCYWLIEFLYDGAANYFSESNKILVSESKSLLVSDSKKILVST